MARTGTEAATRGDELALPPGFELVSLRERGDAFAHARAIAAERGAGTLVRVRRFDTVELAIVLEPEGPLSAARRALYAAMNAMGDAIATHCPPEKPLAFAWPDTILLDGAILGGARLAWPDGVRDDEVPEWLVAGLMLRAVVSVRAPLPVAGAHPLDQRFGRGTSLEAEGFAAMDTAELIGSFARHLMVQFDLWGEKGFVPVGQQFLARLPAEKGATRGIDGNGDLLVRRITAPREAERQSLVAALARPQWMDPETEEPWL